MPTRCIFCGVPLHGGATVHTSNCRIQAIIKKAIKEPEKDRHESITEQKAKEK